LVSYTSWCRDRRSSVKARPRHHPFGPELLAAPGADNQIRLSRDHLIHGCDAIHGGASVCTVGEDVDAAGDLNELCDPSNPEIGGSSHSSKDTLGCRGRHSAR
jgi:hypothetical protein